MNFIAAQTVLTYFNKLRRGDDYKAFAPNEQPVYATVQSRPCNVNSFKYLYAE